MVQSSAVKMQMGEMREMRAGCTLSHSSLPVRVEALRLYADPLPQWRHAVLRKSSGKGRKMDWSMARITRRKKADRAWRQSAGDPTGSRHVCWRRAMKGAKEMQDREAKDRGKKMILIVIGSVISAYGIDLAIYAGFGGATLAVL